MLYVYYIIYILVNGKNGENAFLAFVTKSRKSPPSLTHYGISNFSFGGGQFSFNVNGQSGPDFAIEASTNLTQWNSVFVTNSPFPPFVWMDTNSPAAPQHFYRVKLGPPLT